MPLRTFTLPKGGKLEIEWKGMWRDVAVRVDGALVGSVPTQKDMKAGRTFALPDGSTLRLQLENRGDDFNLHVLVDDKPIQAGRLTRPTTQMILVATLLIFFAFVNAAFGVVIQAPVLLASPPLLDLNGEVINGYALLMAGVVFFVLALLVAQRRVWAVLLGVLALIAQIAALAVTFLT
jgi:hypothetical protein